MAEKIGEWTRSRLERYLQNQFKVSQPNLPPSMDLQNASVTKNLKVTGGLSLSKSAAGEHWRYVGDAGQPAFQNSWVAYGGPPYANPRFRKDALGMVHLQGLALAPNPITGITIFTLPPGYRPSDSLIFAGNANSLHTDLRIENSGVVTISGGAINGGWHSVVCQFLAEQ